MLVLVVFIISGNNSDTSIISGILVAVLVLVLLTVLLLTLLTLVVLIILVVALLLVVVAVKVEAVEAVPVLVNSGVSRGGENGRQYLFQVFALYNPTSFKTY